MVDKLYSLSDLIGEEKEEFLDNASDPIIRVFAAELTRRGISLIDYLPPNPSPPPKGINTLEFLLGCYKLLPDSIRQHTTIMDFIFYIFFRQQQYCLRIPTDFIEQLVHEAERIDRETRRH
jgi:hypothetical protein